MSETTFLSPIKTLKRPGDIFALILLNAGLGLMLAYSMSPATFTKPLAILATLLTFSTAGYLISNYAGREKSDAPWLSWLTATVAMCAIPLVAFVHPAWLPFAWCLPVEFAIAWGKLFHHNRKKSVAWSNAATLAIIALGLHSTYSAVTGHWTLWLYAGVFWLACAVLLASTCDRWITGFLVRRSNRRTQREFDLAWEHNRPVVEALLLLARELVYQGEHDRLVYRHEVKQLTADELIETVRQRILSLKAEDTAKGHSLEQLKRTETRLDIELRSNRAARAKLAKLVFVTLARFRNAQAPVDEGTLAQWRRDIGFELVASHLLDMSPEAFEDFLRHWPVSGAYVKALLRHDQKQVTGYPPLPEEWRRLLSAIYIANTGAMDESATPAPSQT